MDDLRFVIAAYAAGGVILAGYVWQLMRRLRDARARALTSDR
jgi:nitrate reductase gamma subunit